MRRLGRRIAEVSALAMDGDRRTHGLPVLMRLLRLVLLHAASVAQLDDLCLVVRPQHAQFYQQLGICRAIGEPRDYEKVHLDGAVALHIDLHEIRVLIRSIQAGQTPANPIQAFIAGAAYQEIVAQLERELPAAAMTAERFGDFFSLDEVLADAAPWERLYVESLHGLPAGSGTAPGAPISARSELAA
jgi:hypothetical protein